MELKELDVFIKTTDETHNTYEATNEANADYILNISFVNSVFHPDRVYYVATYEHRTKLYRPLITFREENLDLLINNIHQWNVTHKISH